MQQGPANQSIQVTVVGSIWGFGNKTDGTVIDYIQFAEQGVGGYFVNDIPEVEDRQDSQLVKQEADSQFNFGLEMLDVSLEGECTI